MQRRGGGDTGQSWGKQWGDPIRYVMKGARAGVEGSRGAEKWSEPMTSSEKGRKADQATPHSPAAPSGQMASGSEPGRVLTRTPSPCPCGVEKEMATHSSILAWRIPGTEEPGGLPSMGSQRGGLSSSSNPGGGRATPSQPCSPHRPVYELGPRSAANCWVSLG